jgi:Uma2 family endonuclease
MSVAPVPPASGEWTAEDYDALPEDGYRRELIEGVLHVAASPAGRHQRVALHLGVMLDLSAPPGVVVTQAVEVRLGPKLRYIPDLLAVTTEEYGDGSRSQYVPEHVLLAVEIMSDSSRGMDRILKPNHYAAAGIANYWRLELDPEPRVFAYETDFAGGYLDAGEFSGKFAVTRPWPIEIDLSKLPR